MANKFNESDEVIIRTGINDARSRRMLNKPNLRNGGSFVENATALDLYFYNLYTHVNALNNFAYDPDSVNVEGNDTNAKSTNYTYTVSGLGNDGNMTISIAVELKNESEFVITLKRISGDKSEFKNICRSFKYIVTGIHNNRENNIQNGGRRRRTQRSKSRRSKSRRSRR